MGIGNEAIKVNLPRMQLRGLVAVFAILLIIYSVWLLSFTWFVNKHESKMADRAQAYMNATYP